MTSYTYLTLILRDMIDNKNTRRMELHKEAILSDAKKKLNIRDFMKLQKLLNKLKTINRICD